MIDVVFPTYITDSKQLAMSIRNIELARSCTSVPFNLIIVETCSNYLNEYADTYIYERKKTNATKSINKGFFCCDSPKTVLLTNDVGVREGWLEALLECFDRKSDCGVSTLASTQFNHTQCDKIEEGIWGSVFMIPTEWAQFDNNYVNSWDDSDLWMQVYARGYKMYRNFSCVVEHYPGQTHYQDPQHQVNYDRNCAYFTDKWKDSKLPLYQILTKGYVV